MALSPLPAIQRPRAAGARGGGLPRLPIGAYHGHDPNVQQLIGSSYPFRPIGQSIEDARWLGFSDGSLEKFFHLNPRRLLRLD